MFYSSYSFYATLQNVTDILIRELCLNLTHYFRFCPPMFFIRILLVQIPAMPQPTPKLAFALMAASSLSLSFSLSLLLSGIHSCPLNSSLLPRVLLAREEVPCVSNFANSLIWFFRSVFILNKHFCCLYSWARVFILHVFCVWMHTLTCTFKFSLSRATYNYAVVIYVLYTYTSHLYNYTVEG